MSDILVSVFQAFKIILDSAVNTSLKILFILFDVGGSFGSNARNMSLPQLVFYALIIFAFVVLILKFLKNSLKSLFYFGLISFLFWLFFL